MSKVTLKLAAGLFSAVLAACGGGGGTAATSATSNTSGTTAAGTSGASNGSQDSPSTPGGVASAPMTAALTMAPADGASLSGTVRLEVRGTSIENVELLPPAGYTPVLGRFTVAADKTMAWLDFDTRTLPNGTLLARISAFNQPAGSTGAAEIVAMPARTWMLRNDPPPAPAQIPAATYMPEVQISNLALPYVDPAALSTMMQMNDADYEAMLQNEWPRVEDVMHRYIPANVVLYPPTPLGFSGPWDSCMQFHTRLACREAMNNMIGLMLNKRS